VSGFAVTDRYAALGMPLPDRETVCQGQCEGIGWVPTKEHDPADGEGDWPTLWAEAHAMPHREPCDGWHFVKCPTCKGTGKRA
jgi:hypothetical protein